MHVQPLRDAPPARRPAPAQRRRAHVPGAHPPAGADDRVERPARAGDALDARAAAAAHGGPAGKPLKWNSEFVQASPTGRARAIGVAGHGAPVVTKTQRMTPAPAGRHSCAACAAPALAAVHPTATRPAATRRPFGIASTFFERARDVKLRARRSAPLTGQVSGRRRAPARGRARRAGRRARAPRRGRHAAPRRRPRRASSSPGSPPAGDPSPRSPRRPHRGSP